MMDSPLWQCPICHLDGKEPSYLCRRCGCNLLMLVKLKVEAQMAVIRAEEARGYILNTPFNQKVQPALRAISFKKNRGFFKKFKISLGKWIFR